MPAATVDKKKLSISPYTVETNGSLSVDESNCFEVMLNPSSYTYNRSISYNKKKPVGKSGADAEFFTINTEKISFDIVIDGTGVIDTGGSDVKTQIEQLNNIIYKYDGSKHEPNRVRLLWGSLIFYGRLESSSIDYTLFKPNGDPLRAKIKLAFTSAMTSKEEALAAQRSSPDLTHVVEVREGDTLPLLCYRVYKDCSYYLQVAEANNLTDFRRLKPGTKLSFPPLR